MERRARRTIVAVVAVGAAVGAWQSAAMPDGGGGEARRAAVLSGVQVAAPRDSAPRARVARRGEPRATTLDFAEALAERFDLTVTSGYRDPAHNAAVGGAEGSYHTRGSAENPGAVDLVGTDKAMEAALAFAHERVPNLAEAMIHSVCVADSGRPWEVTDSGLHLHLAFELGKRSIPKPDVIIGVDKAQSCLTAADRFAVAVAAIAHNSSAGDWSPARAAKATMRVTLRALRGSYGDLTAADRAAVLDARRRAQETLARPEQQGSGDATTTDDDQSRAYATYLERMDAIDELEIAGTVTGAEADQRRLDETVAALAGSRGKLTAAERLDLAAERDVLAKSVAQAAQQGDGSATTPTTTTQTAPTQTQTTPTQTTPAQTTPAQTTPAQTAPPPQTAPPATTTEPAATQQAPPAPTQP